MPVIKGLDLFTPHIGGSDGYLLASYSSPLLHRVFFIRRKTKTDLGGGNFFFQGKKNTSWSISIWSSSHHGEWEKRGKRRLTAKECQIISQLVTMLSFNLVGKKLPINRCEVEYQPLFFIESWTMLAVIPCRESLVSWVFMEKERAKTRLSNPSIHMAN